MASRAINIQKARERVELEQKRLEELQNELGRQIGREFMRRFPDIESLKDAKELLDAFGNVDVSSKETKTIDKTPDDASDDFE